MPKLLRQPVGFSLVVGKLYRLGRKITGWNNEQYPVQEGSLMLVMGIAPQKRKLAGKEKECVLLLLNSDGKKLEWAMRVMQDGKQPVYAFFPSLEEIE